jgi:3'-phosphoadenosine 5'-phosphosulfate sulfotransferase (PAPS reductase)/FAD synthetase
MIKPLVASTRVRSAYASSEHLKWLEAQAIHIIREVASQCSRPALLFSAGKDSVVLFHLARKAFCLGTRALALPFPLVHIDTGHNFPEVISFRDENRQANVSSDRYRPGRRLNCSGLRRVG